MLYNKREDKDPASANDFNAVTIVMGSKSRGISNYLFKIGSSKHNDLSNFVEASLTICGLEKLSLTSDAVQEYAIKKDDSTDKFISPKEYVSWFTLVAGKGSSD